jgi:multiple sugar transport system ATP-binding protein
MTMADKIVVMNAGRVEQVGTPLALYNQPANLFVAGFIGSPAMNFFDAQSGGDGVLRLAGGGTLKLSGDNLALAPRVATVGVRPEHLTVADAGAAGSIEGQVSITEKLGSVTQAYVQRPSGPVLVQLAGQWSLKEGSAIVLSLPEPAVHLFDSEGRRLNGPSIGGPAPQNMSEGV